MARKSLGFTRTEWTCPNCDAVNPGPVRVCPGCGTPQPDNVDFQQSLQEAFITDEAELAQAKRGPDVHCAFCGTRNPADAETCSQCGAPLAEGQARAAGTVLGAHRADAAPPLICGACGAENDAAARFCTTCGNSLAGAKQAVLQADQPEPEPAKKPQPGRFRLIFWGAIGLLMLACGLCFAAFGLGTDEVTARVESVSWTRSIAIEALVDVDRRDWADDIPSAAVVGQCREQVRRTVDQPPMSGRYDEVCGTPYTIDRGNGFAEVVQDCQYEVYDTYCDYTIKEWDVIDTAVLEGRDYNPRWPALSLGAQQREGPRDEEYRVVFNNDGQRYTFTTSNEALFRQCRIDSRWQLSINVMGGVVDIEPAAPR